MIWFFILITIPAIVFFTLQITYVITESKWVEYCMPYMLGAMMLYYAMVIVGFIVTSIAGMTGVPG